MKCRMRDGRENEIENINYSGKHQLQWKTTEDVSGIFGRDVHVENWAISTMAFLYNARPCLVISFLALCSQRAHSADFFFFLM